MGRVRLTIEYDGGPFVGWQRQDNGQSVQGAIESAAEGFCGRFVTVFGAGRTDAGVHAWGQVAHLDLPREEAEETVRDALNFHLKPNPVSILKAERVAEDFDARGDARERRYLYRIANRRAPLASRPGDRPSGWSNAATWASACTPASVRPAISTRPQPGAIRSRTVSMAP